MAPNHYLHSIAFLNELAAEAKRDFPDLTKEEERACWSRDDQSGSLARFIALAKSRQVEAGQSVDPVRALRWAHFQISLRNGSRYPQRRQPVGRVRRVGA